MLCDLSSRLYNYAMPIEDKARDSYITLRLKRPPLWGLLTLATIVTAAILLLVVRAHTATTGANIFSGNLQKQAPFPLYYVHKVPHGLHIQKNSISYSDAVVTFSLSDGQGQSLAISEQATPEKFDFTKFYKDNVRVSQQLPTNEGEVTFGTFNGLQVCMLVTPRTWIIVNDLSGAHPSQLNTLCRNLKAT